MSELKTHKLPITRSNNTAPPERWFREIVKTLEEFEFPVREIGSPELVKLFNEILKLANAVRKMETEIELRKLRNMIVEQFPAVVQAYEQMQSK